MAHNDNPPATDQNDEAVQAVERIIEAKASSLKPYERVFLEMLRALEDIATDDTSSRVFTGEDIYRILAAETEEEMWDADELPGYNAKVLSGCDLDLTGIEVKFSNDPDINSIFIGPKTRRKMYLMVHATRLNSNEKPGNVYRLPEVGDPFMWNTSAKYIVPKLYRLQKFGRFDSGRTVPVTIQGTALSGARSVEKLKPLGAVTVNTTTEPPF